MKALDLIFEDVIGQFRDKIDIVYNVDKTQHAGERQYRDSDYITNDEINTLVHKCMERIIKSLIFNTTDIGTPIHLQDTTTNLNIVATTRKEGDRIKFIIITVMKKPNFYAKPGTYHIEV